MTTSGGFGPDALVQISPPCGQLLGSSLGGTCVFKGIPYAQPPVGELRWQPPQPLQRWSGTRPALAFGPAPMQTLPPRSSLMYQMNHADTDALVMSEDCLYLNVWSPDISAGAGLPVLVWLHGGGNRTGHAGSDLFDGSRLVARGLVVVTVNMRLGALGFLSLPELAAENPLGASGNYGVQDVVAALQWVQSNIAAFGGDPSRVTLAGNSSGAASITHLMAAPAARGLFSAAIGQSASGIFRPEMRMLSQAEAADQGQRAVSTLGSSLAQLRDLPATALLHLPPQGVVIDGRLLTEDSTEVFLAGRQASIPLLAGWNGDEGSLYASAAAAMQVLEEAGSVRAGLEQHYQLTQVDSHVAGQRLLVGDRRFVYPVWRWACTHAQTSGAATWLYEFAQQPPLPEEVPSPADGCAEYGAFHTAELPYVWDNLAARDWAWSDADHALADQIATTWARFAINGNPNGADLPQWSPVQSTGECQLMRFGAPGIQVSVPRSGAFELFDEIHFAQRGN